MVELAVGLVQLEVPRRESREHAGAGAPGSLMARIDQCTQYVGIAKHGKEIFEHWKCTDV